MKMGFALIDHSFGMILWRRRVWGRWGRQFGPIWSRLAAPTGITTACDFPPSRQILCNVDRVSVHFLTAFQYKPWSFPKYWSRQSLVL